MIILTIPVGELDTNCYLVAPDGNSAGVVIDPGGEAEKILDAAAESGIDIQKIFVTHGHWDHIGALDEIAKATGAEVIVHRLDAGYMSDPAKNLSGLFFQAGERRRADRVVDDGDVINVGGLDYRILGTPGHTPGAMSIYVGNSLFCGDLIFCGSIGRTDLPGGSSEEMHHSVHSVAMSLPDDTKIFPGHGPATTVAREREHNPYLTGGW